MQVFADRARFDIIICTITHNLVSGCSWTATLDTSVSVETGYSRRTVLHGTPYRLLTLLSASGLFPTWLKKSKESLVDQDTSTLLQG